jgi:hypothetical protein
MFRVPTLTQVLTTLLSCLFFCLPAPLSICPSDLAIFSLSGSWHYGRLSSRFSLLHPECL